MIPATSLSSARQCPQLSLWWTPVAVDIFRGGHPGLTTVAGVQVQSTQDLYCRITELPRCLKMFCQCGRSRPILDSHVTYMDMSVIDFSQENKIELLSLPVHSTHLLQPLDVGYYHLLKEHFTSLSVSLGYCGLKCTKTQISQATSSGNK